MRATEFTAGDCPQAGCDCPIRFVVNARENTVSAYHGEDKIVEMTTPAGTSVVATLGLLDLEGDTRADFVEFMGVQLAIAVLDIHRKEL